MTGSLVLVATPIGNLGDLAPRAVEAFGNAGLVCCEDTRRTGLLLSNLGIDAPLMRLDDHTEHHGATRVLEVLRSGRDVVVVTDAGTPGISDPGERVVRAAIADGLPVTSIPGPSALLAAVVVSGLPTDRFVFEGFLPRRGDERKRRLGEIARERRTVVLYEAPHRLLETTGDLLAACGDRPVAVARELTKVHEEIWRGTLAQFSLHTAQPRGEYVIVLGGRTHDLPTTDDEIDAALRAELEAGSSVKDAASTVAELAGIPKREAYQRAMRLRD